MKRSSFATLWLLLLSGGGLWAAPSATPARKNLYDRSNYMESTDKRLPGAVRQAANGIYEMLVTTPAQRFLIQSELEALAKTCDAAHNPSKSTAPQANGPPAAASGARGSSPPPKRARAADLVLPTPQAQPVSAPPSCAEVQGCLSKGQSICRVSGFTAETRQGTAFFDAKTKCLWTARHVVDPQIRELLLQLEHAQDDRSLDPRDIAAAFNVPFVLKDQSQKVVFDSTGPDQARVGMLLPSLITDEKAAFGLFMGRQERHYDSMCLKLSRDVETSVVIRGGRIGDGEELYIGGYPVLWGRNKKVAVQDKLLFSRGYKMNWTERKTKIYAPALDEATKESPGEPSLVDQAPTGALAWVLEWTAYGKNSLTNIAVPGMSGSPVLDKEGHVVGVFPGGSTDWAAARGIVYSKILSFDGIITDLSVLNIETIYDVDMRAEMAQRR